MKRKQEKERYDRLSFKTLDRQFQQEAIVGLSCSPLEAKALTEIVKGVYFPLLEERSIENIRPGQIVVQAIELNEPPGKPIKKCLFKSVILTIDSGQSDLKIRQEEGIPALRRERIKRVTKEAFKQGTLLTAGDMAYKIFRVGYRTIIRDLDILRKRGEHIPLRSTQRDIGRTTTHKEQIVKLWLEGNEPAYISKATNHSVDAVSRYLQTFKRVVALTLEGKDKTSIAFLLSISKPLVTRYQKLFERYKDDYINIRTFQNLFIILSQNAPYPPLFRTITINPHVSLEKKEISIKYNKFMQNKPSSPALPGLPLFLLSLPPTPLLSSVSLRYST